MAFKVKDAYYFAAPSGDKPTDPHQERSGREMDDDYRPIFDGLQLMQPQSTPTCPRLDGQAVAPTTSTRSEDAELRISSVPSGSFLRLAVHDKSGSSSSHFAQRAELSLMKLLKGSLRAQRGSIGCYPTQRCELVVKHAVQMVMLTR